MTQERIEAAAKALNASYPLRWAMPPWDELVKSKDRANQNRVKLDREYASSALAAADAHDAVNGVHRVSLDDATIERAAEALFMANNPEADWHRFSKMSRVTDAYRKQARAVLAAAVKEEQ
ncbi:hypothetical protein ACLRGI_04900 [Paenarthrobacter nitroguajacolicus]|uniref:hypothetical protein n=1 Tax=Paenarthrobacter nitroguajacolicus TaxID=211146 RepID=UPI003AEDA416